MSTRRCWPPESRATSAWARSSSPTAAIDSRTTSTSSRPLRPPPRAVRQPADLDDLGHGRAHRGGQGVVLGDVADPGELAEALAGDAEEPHLAALLLDEPEQPAHERGLAAPVGPEEGQDLAAPDRQVDGVDDRAVAVAERRRAQLDERACRPTSRALLALPQGREVAAHHLKVVLAGRGVGEPFDRVEHGGGRPGLAGDGLGEGRADQGLGVDRRDPVLRDVRGEVAQRRGVGLGVGVDARRCPPGSGRSGRRGRRRRRGR